VCPPNIKPLLDLSNFGDEVLEVVDRVQITEKVIYDFLTEPFSEAHLLNLKRQISSKRIKEVHP